jgi:hypothetical protein
MRKVVTIVTLAGVALMLEACPKKAADTNEAANAAVENAAAAANAADAANAAAENATAAANAATDNNAAAANNAATNNATDQGSTDH